MWPPPRSSRRWPSSCPQRGSRFHPWEVVQASGYNSRHDNSCIACRNSPGWSDGLLIAQPLWHASLSERRQPCGRACCPHRCAGSSDACCIPALSCPREDCRQASLSGWTCSNPRETLEAQTARDCGIGSSISCRFLLILTPKGSHFK